MDGRARTGWRRVPAGILLAGLLVGPAAAPAAETLEVRVGPAVPFSRTELAEALRLRREPRLPGSPPESVAVTADGDLAGAVWLMVGNRQRQVALGESGGREAARLVALLALDLLEQGESAPERESETAIWPRPPPPGPPEPAVTSAAAPEEPPAGWALTPSFTMGPQDGRLELGVEMALALTRSWRLIAYGGYGQAQARSAFLNSAVIRGGLGFALLGGELQGGGLVRGHWEGDAGGTVSGAWLQARVTLWRRPSWMMHGLVALEMVPQRVDQSVATESRRTLKVMPMVGLGVTLP